MTSEIRFNENYSASWIDQILDLHNKTEMKRRLDRKQMINDAFESSFAVVTAWMESQLVGCGRMISDGEMYSGIFDVVVDPEFQKKGIGQEIMRRLISKAPHTCIHLTSTFGNEQFYAKLGFKKHKTAMALYPGKIASSAYLEELPILTAKSSTKRLPIQVLVIPYVKHVDGIKVALFRRKRAGYWQFIAGGAEAGETIMDAAKREAFEEAGISMDSQINQLDTVCTVPANNFKDWKNWPQGTHVVKEYAFSLKPQTSNLVLSDEHSEYKWCSYEEAQELLKWDSNKTALWELSQRLSAPKMIEVVPHNPEWSETFKTIKNKLWPRLEGVALSMEHVGSTSVPDLHAKPIVDIAVIVDSPVATLEAIQILQNAGYEHRGDLGIKGREAFKRPEDSPKHNLYVALKNCLSLRNHIAVKKHLLTSKEAREEYSRMKLSLAEQYSDNEDMYCSSKTDFLIKILKISGFSHDELNEIREANKPGQVHPVISEAKIADLGEICRLTQDTFGPHPKSEEIFKKWIEEPQYHVTVARVDNEIVGMSAAYINIEPDLSKYELFGKAALDFLRAQKLGWFLTLAVHPQFRRNQIGWKLAKEQSEWLKKQDCTALLGSSWVSGSMDNSTHMFIKAGFQKLGESNEFLRNQLRGTGSTCSACGKTDCECTSVLFGMVTK